MYEVKERNYTRSQMIENNTGLVHACAHRFKGKGIEYEDLFQAGCIGLIKASDAFDFSRGVRFSTYAVPVILGEIRRLFRDGGAVKVSRSVKELSLKVTRERERFASKNNTDATVGDLAKILEVSSEAIVEALGVSVAPISLTESEENGGGQFDLPIDSSEERYSDVISLNQSLETLNEKDRVLVYLRFYLDKTQTETAKRLCMTQVQVSRREKKILDILKKQME